MTQSPGETDTREYIWISRWEEFQHYKPERDRAPAWIKAYTKPLDDDRYLKLSTHSRGLLHDLRMAFARAHGELPMNTRQLSHRLHYRVTTPHIELLNHAGFIDILSRQTLEQRLEELYSDSSPRARPRAHREVEREEEPKAVPIARPPAPDLEYVPNGRVEQLSEQTTSTIGTYTDTDNDIPF